MSRIKYYNITTQEWEYADGLSGSGTVENAVLYAPQTLTDAQKAQARFNIGAGTGGGEGLSEDVKTALLECFKNVGWIDDVDDYGQSYYSKLRKALYPPISISAVFTQGGTVIYDTDTLESLKQYLVVTATYGDGTLETLTSDEYVLSGALTEGQSTITVTCAGKTDTFTVSVTHMVNGLVDGTYSKNNASLTVNNNKITWADNLQAYQNIKIPLKGNINVSAGDVVTFKTTCDNPDGLNHTNATRIEGMDDWVTLSPVRYATSSKSATMTKDASATYVEIQSTSEVSNAEFTLSISINGEVIF